MLLYKERESVKGFAFSKDDEFVKMFEDKRPFTLTKDQENSLREIKEETGIEAKILDSSEIKCKFSAKEAQIPTPYLILSEFIPTKGDKEAHIHIDLIYLAVADEKEVVKQEDEVEDVKWMTWEEVLESNTFESIKEFARKRVGENERTQNSINSIL